MDCSSNNETMGWEIPSIDNLFRIDPQLRMFEKEIRKQFVLRYFQIQIQVCMWLFGGTLLNSKETHILHNS